MLAQIEQSLLGLANSLPVEIFTVVGAFIEEIIAPIPSPLIMMTAGLVAAEQGYTVLNLLFLALIGAIAKTIASVILYFIVDKFEDVFMRKFGKFIGLTTDFSENIGKKLNKGKLDYLTFFLLRATPVIPSAPVSVLAGFFKVNLKAYTVGTFFGVIIRNIIYLGIGFWFSDLITQFEAGFATFENVFQLLIVICFFAWIVYWKLTRK
jgi:membrane protein DedA with SNARE-associated domain